MTGLNDLTDTGPFVDLLAQYLRVVQQWSCMDCGTTWFGGPDHACGLAMVNSPAIEHRLKVQILKAFKVRPYWLGVDMGCSCHSAPFPAARDYRRRTKHRNRRRR